jgi:ribosomal protein L37AE/L43A
MNLVPPNCKECGHKMVEGDVGPTELWCCPKCGVTDLKGGPYVTEGAELIMFLTQPKAP